MFPSPLSYFSRSIPPSLTLFTVQFGEKWADKNHANVCVPCCSRTQNMWACFPSYTLIPIKKRARFFFYQSFSILFRLLPRLFFLQSIRETVCGQELATKKEEKRGNIKAIEYIFLAWLETGKTRAARIIKAKKAKWGRKWRPFSGIDCSNNFVTACHDMENSKGSYVPSNGRQRPIHFTEKSMIIEHGFQHWNIGE